jgi:hypothetical protein
VFSVQRVSYIVGDFCDVLRVDFEAVVDAGRGQFRGNFRVVGLLIGVKVVSV